MSFYRTLSSQFTLASVGLGRLHWACLRSVRGMATVIWVAALGLSAAVWSTEHFVLAPLREEKTPLSTTRVTPPPVEAPSGNTPLPSRALIDALLIDMNRLREQAGLQWGAGGLSVRPLDIAAIDATPQGASLALGRQEIAMSLSGSYAPMRRMVADLLNVYPTLALLSLDVRRDGSDKNKIEAQLQWLFVHRAASQEAITTLPQQRAVVKASAADPFALPLVAARVAPVRAAPPPAPEPPPAPPSAPPLPFKFLGRVLGSAASGSTEAVFLSQGNRVWRVKSGDTLLDQYRVDALEEGAIRFTYLPLNQPQSLLLR